MTAISKPCEECHSPFLGGPHSRFGPCCRWKQRGHHTPKYQWNDNKDAYLRQHYNSKVPNRTAAIATTLGWPTWVIKRRAQLLGLAHPWPATRRAWTIDEERYLEAHAGKRHVHYLARQLKRPVTSVVLKLKRMNLRRRVVEGYTLRDLEDCLGMDHHAIERLVREGKLNIRRRNPDASAHSPWFVTDKDLRTMIRAYPTSIRLDKVDQLWFLDLILGTTLMEHAA